MWMTWAFRPGLLDDGSVTVEVEGTPAVSALLQLAEEVAQHAATGTTVIIDLDRLVLTSPSAMRGFIGHLNHRCRPGGAVLACRRSTGRQLLRRWAAGSLPVVAGHAEPAAT